MIDPQDVERAGIALSDEPAEIGEVMGEPEAGNREGDGRVGARSLERGEKRPVEWPSARAEIPGEEISRRRPWVSPAFWRKPRWMRPGASADSLIARPIRVDLSSASLISLQVQQAARSSRVVRASGSASKASFWPATLISRIATALRPSAATHAFSVGR